MKLFHSEQQTKFICKLCTFKTIHKRTLLNHSKTVHKVPAFQIDEDQNVIIEEQDFHSCDSCDFHTTQKKKLFLHRKSHYED